MAVLRYLDVVAFLLPYSLDISEGIFFLSFVCLFAYNYITSPKVAAFPRLVLLPQSVII